LYFVAPFLMFIYMTADAVDGKHARATGQSSPLGAIVDHGIDAFLAFTTGVAVTSTTDPALSTSRMMLSYCMFLTAWFCAQWGELELGSLDQRGITEGEFLTMFCLALPGLFGLDFMSHDIMLPVLGAIQFRYIFEYGVIFGCGAVTVSFVARIVMAASGRRFQACWPFFHMCLHNIVSVLLSRTRLGLETPLFTFILVGMNAAMLMTKIRLVATLHCAWPVMHFEMLPFVVVAVAHIAGADCGIGVFIAVLLWQAFSFAWLWHDTITRICRVLNIPFLAPVPSKEE